jgi:hypothetical protein
MSQLLSLALIINKATSVNLNTLINQICKEADQLKSWQAKGQGGKNDHTTDEALTTIASNDGRQWCHKGKCHNCGKQGHWAKECCSPKKDKEESAGTQSVQAPSTSSKLENKPVGSANVVYNIEGDGFWMATEEAINHMHLVSVEPDPLLSTLDDTKVAPHWKGEEIELSTEEWIGAVITPADEDNHVRIELYDSGTTQHISPYKSDFTSYVPLVPPNFMNTANQQ